jgi:hypothetical protein
MWKVFPMLGILKILFLFFSALLISAIIITLPSEENNLTIGWNTFESALGLATPVTFSFLLITYIIGKWVWIVFWKAPLLGNILNQHVCPNLNGSWKGKVESNFLNHEKKMTVKEIKIDIKADLFGFNIKLDSLDKYQNSKVICSEIFKDKKTGTFYIIYIFEGFVPIPKESDDRTFEGSAKLEISFEEKSISLKGTYWTNRAWQRRKNTAGIISATRS